MPGTTRMRAGEDSGGQMYLWYGGARHEPKEKLGYMIRRALAWAKKVLFNE